MWFREALQKLNTDNLPETAQIRYLISDSRSSHIEIETSLCAKSALSAKLLHVPKLWKLLAFIQKLNSCP